MATYKRSIFVVNPKFQYKFSLVVCSLVLICSMIYPLRIYDIFEQIFALNPDMAEKIKSNRDQLLLFLGIMQLAILGIVFVITIFISHKIAGPMYKLKTYLTNIKNGGEVTPLYFRKGDYFSEIADDVNDFIHGITHQRTQDFEYLQEVSSYIANLALVVPEDKKPVLQEILSKLAEIQSRN